MTRQIRKHAKKAWMKAKKQESTTTEWEDSIEQSLAESQFERYWERNYHE
jgi:hypothetical protein